MEECPTSLIRVLVGKVLMPGEAPIVRHLIACLEIISTPASVTLVDLIHAIVPLAGEKYPCIRPRMALYALLTNGRGVHEIGLELTRFDQGQEVPIARPPSRPVDLGSDPTAVLGLPIPLRNVVFPLPGQYTFHLLCDGDSIAEEKIVLREES